MTSVSPDHTRGRWLAVLVVALAGLVAVVVAAYWLGSRASDEPRSGSSPTPAIPGAARDTGPVVLVISVDGLHPDAIGMLGRSGAPALHRLLSEGASTLNARTAVESTRTLPNHTGMLTGRGVDGRRGHGVTFNDDDGETLEDTHGSYVPGMFDVAHDRGLQTAFFAEKDKFHYLLRSWDEKHGRKDVTGSDHGRDKTDVDRIGDARQIVAAVEQTLLDGRTDLIFLHLSAPDRAGHDAGWLSDRYLAAVQSADASIGAILAVVDAHPRLRGRVTVVATADHGGTPGATKHNAEDDLANHRIPFIAWGRGVEPGTDLYAMNAGRRDPEDGRPGYAGPQPIRNLDVAGAALRLLGLPQLPDAVASSWPPLNLRARVG